MAEHYDLAVIGGGINGAGIARDAAGRGLKVALIERGDLAQGTSSASTKLIHGGLRYLEHYEFALVRESLIERERLWAIAPHIIWPLRFVLPHLAGVRPRWLVRLGLFLYDHIGGRKRLPAARSLDLTRDPAGRSLKPEFKRGFEYSDCWVDDARLVILNARDAAARSAAVLTRHDVTALKRVGNHWQLTMRRADGTMISLTASAVVNAAGPAVAQLLDTQSLAHKTQARLVRGSHIVVPRKYEHDRAYFCQNRDGRIFFAIPYERDFTLIGTTDADHEGPVEGPRASAEEIAYLCEGASQYFVDPVTPDQIVWSYAGIRPLIDDGSGRPEAATRGYRFEVDTAGGKSAPILSIFGGKITTYRHLAESAVAELAQFFPALAGPGWTGGAPLPGGDCGIDGIEAAKSALAARYPWLGASEVGRLFHSYGTDAEVWLKGANDRAALGQDFGHGLSEAEVRYLVAQEWARTAEDILWRRGKLGLRFGAADVAALDAFVETLVSRD
ncbi:MAG: glycerol-3-phosphate dehydrogenase [Sphingopyxis sp.]|nr:glycerol-3-phosphate dehydrogenase [Sphingopyxis sp.]